MTNDTAEHREKNPPKQRNQVTRVSKYQSHPGAEEEKDPFKLQSERLTGAKQARQEAAGKKVYFLFVYFFFLEGCHPLVLPPVGFEEIT